ncbi:zinc ribbon domain-containing protein [Granulosicoccus sp. 3-233]
MRGTRCAGTGSLRFPIVERCPRCSVSEDETDPLGTIGWQS